MDIKNTAIKAHEQALKKARKKLPKTDVNTIISYVQRLYKGEDIRALSAELAKKYSPAVITYIKSFAETGIQDTLKQSDHEVLKNLSKNNFAHALTSASPKIFTDVKSYFDGEIDEGELLVRLCKDGQAIRNKILDACGIKSDQLKEDSGMLWIVVSSILAYQASMAAYKEYCAAMKALALAREEREKAEKLCKETVSCIREYRSLMEKQVSEYLNLRLDVIADSFLLMDKAILENDADGFIAGNVELQQMLGYDTQFTSQEEFDDLMYSDQDFKL